MRILILAGTGEATVLAGALTEQGHEVISSLAGVTSSPRPRPGLLRRGGFGGVAGLIHYLTETAIDALIDATHPFAAVMPHHAAAATEATATPHCRLLRPPWSAQPGDEWYPVPDLAAVPAQLAALGARRIFLTIGRQALGSLADGEIRNHTDGEPRYYLARAIEPIGDALPGAVELLDRGPFTVEGEHAVLRAHAIDTLVAKNAGGADAAAKLVAARELGVRVVMVERPPAPDAPHLKTVPTVAAVVDWLDTLAPTPTTRRTHP